ncbi:tripartite tricarboxylate transporter substrate binding protein [Variovorax sp. J22P240]|uniref:tripartite tricarboxylate transporter substrate binding protein n=1 Tax=Variovorax sp. J22P240 TaxID=3053514 RepID=UPI002576477A|nr:tripartite tricarboxylate transporter substrate binding protein [Variovorax sp. J22P240]MDM0003046.1 tripartite tricarboxylate transporter substrate binding protein [Variovorax sp. J22P240]
MGAPAGGTSDIVSRMLADGLQKELNRTVIVEPKPGAGGALAVNDLMQAAHDGNTVLVAPSALVSPYRQTALRRGQGNQADRRTGACRPGDGASSVMPAKNLAEVIAYVKANPGKVSYASYSAGTMSHVMGLHLNKAAGIDMKHVGYKGSPPALADVVGGHVPLMFDGIPTSLPMIKAGRVVPYAVSLPQRSPLLPNVPTFNELGYPQNEAMVWIGLWLTPNVPAAAQERLCAAALKVMAQPSEVDRLQA